MIPDTEYKPLWKSESAGSYGWFGLKIEVAASKLPDLKGEAIRAAVYKAQAIIEDAVRSAAIAADPEALEQAAKERAGILGLFRQPIFVEEIPNGYCSSWCCRHLPWFVVTTSVGRFTIGWRKRVLAIDWAQTQGTATAEDLFTEENVTKGERDIHAWSYEDAARYLAAIIASAGAPNE